MKRLGRPTPSSTTRPWALVALTLSAVVLFVGCGREDKADDNDSSDAPTTTAGSDLDTAIAEMNKGEIVDNTGEASVMVNARDNYFDPKYVEVSKGTAITFINDGRNVHNVLPVAEGAFTQIEADAFDPGKEGQITFDEVGEYPYYCSLHGSRTKGMIGGIKVVE